MKETFEDIDKEKEERIMEFMGEKKQLNEISMDERNRVLNKTRELMQIGSKERLTQDEEKILREIAGVVYIAYKKYIEILDKKERGGIENEQEL